jgi:membrane associated rhomboid family serine protease
MNLVKLFNRFPVTCGTCLLAVIASLAWWSGGNIAPLIVNYHVWSGQFWRPLTATFPHVSLMHLAFNLYWMWRFGSRIEPVFGPLRTAGLYALLAFGSSLAEYDFGGQGVGLSGVGYGLFGFLWVLSRRDRRFSGAVDNQIVVLFIGWFFLCIVLTVKDVMPVGNFAHAAGALLGLLAGWAVAGRYGRNPWLCRAVGAAIFALLVAAGTVARPYVNFTEFAGDEYGQMGYTALTEGHYEDAVRRIRLALDRRGGSYNWYNLGIAYQKLDRWDEAAAAYQTACELARDDKSMQQALAYAKWKSAQKAGPVGDEERASSGSADNTPLP